MSTAVTLTSQNAMLKHLEDLSKGIGSTPLYELDTRAVPNRCRIFVKAEFANPSRSHYDRVFAELFRQDIPSWPNAGPQSVIEVSSGNAGASLAWFCRELGLNCRLILPSSIPDEFVYAIRRINPACSFNQEANPLDYVSGAVSEFRKEWMAASLSARRGGGEFVYFPDHAKRPSSLDAMETVGKECASQLEGDFSVEDLDRFIVACGNGTTAVGIGRALRAKYPGVEILAFEPESTPVGRNAKAGLEPPPRSPLHNLYGTGGFGIDLPFLYDKSFGFAGIVDEVVPLDKGDIEAAEDLRFKLGVSVGRTSLVSLYLALKLANERPLKSTLIVFYDGGEKYDWTE